MQSFRKGEQIKMFHTPKSHFKISITYLSSYCAHGGKLQNVKILLVIQDRRFLRMHIFAKLLGKQGQHNHIYLIAIVLQKYI